MLSIYFSVFEIVDVLIVDADFFSAYLIDQDLSLCHHRCVLTKFCQKMNRYFLPFVKNN